MLRTLLSSRFLVSQLTKREIESQFRGTVLGWLWLFARPLLMLSVYTFVFGVIWRKNSIGEPLAAFSLQLFCGLCIYNFFSQAVSKSVNCIVGKPSFVKQLVFPLEILPWVHFVSAVVCFAIRGAAFVLWTDSFYGAAVSVLAVAAFSLYCRVRLVLFGAWRLYARFEAVDAGIIADFIFPFPGFLELWFANGT